MVQEVALLRRMAAEGLGRCMGAGVQRPGPPALFRLLTTVGVAALSRLLTTAGVAALSLAMTDPLASSPSSL